MPVSAVQFNQRGVVFGLGFFQLALRLVDLVLLALGARFLQFLLAFGHLGLLVPHVGLALRLQAAVGAMGFGFRQGLAQAGFAAGVVLRLGGGDVVFDLAELGRATALR
ncbi:hypothetical protein G6F22_021103 [Rhizopus arrhizus]|nr:hypothetical protein G6F22_021103 [Rhizopus arrhizus]